jgi:hypothetical protein
MTTATTDIATADAAKETVVKITLIEDGTTEAVEDGVDDCVVEAEGFHHADSVKVGDATDSVEVGDVVVEADAVEVIEQDEERPFRPIARWQNRLIGAMSILEGSDGMVRLNASLKQSAGSHRLTRDGYKSISARQTQKMIDRVTRGIKQYFDGAILRGVQEFVKLDITFDTDQARMQSWVAVEAMWDLDEERDLLVLEASRSLLAVFVVGARSEEALFADILDSVTGEAGKAATTAESVAERLEFDVPDGIALGPYPDWMIAEATETLTETMQQDYWQKIPETTRNDVRGTLLDGIETGKSIRTLSKEIMAAHGDTYTQARANAVARTETAGMLNSGHNAAIGNLQAETGIAMGKEWLSVNGNTTREDHSAADGQIVPFNKDFTVGGESAPYPAHMGLSAGQRVNCQCTVLSSFAGNEIFDQVEMVEEQVEEPVDIPIPPPLPTPLAPATPVWENMTFDEIMDRGDEELEAKRQAVLKAKESMTEQLRELREERLEIVGRMQSSVKKRAELMQLGRLEDQDEIDFLTRAITGFAKEMNIVSDKTSRVRSKGVANQLAKLRVKKSERTVFELMEDSNGGPNSLPKMKNRSIMTKAKKVSRQLGELMHAPTHEMWEGSGKIWSGVNQTKTGRAFANGVSVSMSKTNSDAIYAHEFAHNIEMGNVRALRLAKDYRAKKTEGQVAGTFNELYPTHGYGSSEKTLGDDDWRKLVMSDSDAHYIGKTYSDGKSTEVVSMGVELLFENPARFAETDPEYFKLVIGILDGSLL